MEFKFKKGDEVHVKSTEMFSACFGTGVSGPGIRSEITDCRSHPGGKNQYKIKCFTGWWNEESLVRVSRAPENLHCCEESSGPTTYTQNETKCDTGDSGEPENLWDVISELSDIRAGYSVFDDEERAKYHALSVAIEKLREEHKMKFYEIKPGQIINLFIIRTAQVFNNEIYLTFTCGDTRSDRIIFPNNQEAADAFNKLRDELGVEVRNED